MAILLCPEAGAGPDTFSADSGALELEAQSAEGRKVREAAEEARRLWQSRAVFPQSEKSTATALAGHILRDALERYRRPDGYEGHLVEAAWQLEQMGREAWPVLRDLVLAEAQECEHFLGAVVRLEGVAPPQRLTALLAAARNPDPNVRSRLLELLEEMPGDLRREVLRELTVPARPDDSVTERAREAAHEQAS